MYYFDSYSSYEYSSITLTPLLLTPPPLHAQPQSFLNLLSFSLNVRKKKKNIHKGILIQSSQIRLRYGRFSARFEEKGGGVVNEG